MVTVALATLLPPAVSWIDAGRPSWPWFVAAVVATWFVERSRRAGAVAGVTTPAGKQFLYAACWFYVAAAAMVAAVAVLVDPGAVSDPEMVVNVLAPAGAVGAGAWVRLAPTAE